MAARSATARWEGTLKEGEGTLSLESGAFEGKYSFTSRFEDGVTGTNPEELIGAAHAGCYTMQLSNELHKAGYSPAYVSTKAKVHLNRINDMLTINQIDLIVDADVPGVSEEAFMKLAEEAKDGCIISRVLNAEFTLDVTLKN